MCCLIEAQPSLCPLRWREAGGILGPVCAVALAWVDAVAGPLWPRSPGCLPGQHNPSGCFPSSALAPPRPSPLLAGRSATASRLPGTAGTAEGSRRTFRSHAALGALRCPAGGGGSGGVWRGAGPRALRQLHAQSPALLRLLPRGPYEYVLTLRPDLYTAKHTQWFYFRVQNTRRDPLYRFTIANLAKPKSLYGEGMRPLLYSQRDAQSRGIGWRRAGADVRYYRGGREEPATFRLSWTVRFPHDGDTCFFAHSYPYTYSDLQRYLGALAGDPVCSRYCAVRELCRSLAGNTIYLLTITSPAGAAAKRAVVLSARVHPGESGGSWAMRGFLDFLLSAHPDAQLLRRLFVFKVVPMLNPDGVVVGNSRCSLAGCDPNRAYGTVLRGSFPGVWHLRAMVERVLAEREVVLYCDFHGHSRKNNVFMYGCDGSGAGAGPRLRQRVFPLMLSKNAPDKFSFPSCKFKVQKSKARTGRVVMWHMGISNSYTMEVAFGGSTLGGRSSHFNMEDLKLLGYHLCDTLLDFCDPHPAKFQQCLSEVDALLRQRLHREPNSGWSDVSPSELESSTSGSDSSVSDGPPAHFHGPAQPLEQRRRKRRRSRRARNALHRTSTVYQSHASVPARLGTPRPHRQPALPGTPRVGSTAGEEPRGSSSVTFPSAAVAGDGRRAAMVGSQLEGGTSAVSHRRPLLSTHHPGVTGGSSRDTAPGAETRPSQWRGRRAAAVHGRKVRPCLAAPGRASSPAARRCCACARH
ncbi:cytosolic carboxypeptidase 2 isoform 2-T2 [Pluvialis apricaria]